MPIIPYLKDLLTKAYTKDKDIKTLISSIKKCYLYISTSLFKKGYKYYIGYLYLYKGYLYIKNQLFIPISTKLYLYLIQLYYLLAHLSYPSYKSIYKLIAHLYYQPNIRYNLQQFINNYLKYFRVYRDNLKKQGLLELIKALDYYQQSISFNFIKKLPNFYFRNKNYQYILIIVNHLPKIVITKGLPNNSINSLIEAIYYYLFYIYSLIKEFINNYRSTIIYKLQKCVYKYYRIKIKYSLAYYPKTNRQTKVTNKSIKNYLYSYINHL